MLLHMPSEQALIPTRSPKVTVSGQQATCHEPGCHWHILAINRSGATSLATEHRQAHKRAWHEQQAADKARQLEARLRFHVNGVPQGQGRISYYGPGRSAHSNEKLLLPWRAAVANAASAAAQWQGWQLATWKLRMYVLFTHPEGGSRTDLDHLLRAIGDGLQQAGNILKNDSLIRGGCQAEREGPNPGALITLEHIDQPHQCAQLQLP